jgi:hypothetical protein
MSTKRTRTNIAKILHVLLGTTAALPNIGEEAARGKEM